METKLVDSRHRRRGRRAVPPAPPDLPDGMGTHAGDHLLMARRAKVGDLLGELMMDEGGGWEGMKTN